ncbi:hypothetical protein EV1_018666 [Malus domestica]
MREEHGSIHGVRVAPGGVALTHLFFADDAVIFCKAKDEEVLLVMDVLKSYADASSQVINRDKSSLYFGANFSRQRRKQIASCTNIMGRDDFGKYLGIIADFRSLKKTGREVFIKSVAMALLNYAMSCFKLPVGLCKELEAVIAKFW